MKEQTSWYFYDFANSVFSTTVITVFLGPYLTQIANNAADADGNVDVILFKIAAGSLYPLIVSISVILQVVILPLLGAIADNTNYKKQLLFTTAYIGAIATMLLFFVYDSNWSLGALLFIIANINFGASCSIYNSYLNHIASEVDRDAVSSKGWALGYIGGGVLLILNLLLYNNAGALGITDGMAIRICLASAGVWWAIFSLIPMKYLRKVIHPNLAGNTKVISSNFASIIATIKDARNYPNTLLFLLAYMLYNDGVQSVIVLASQFGSAELGLSVDVLITAILIVQFVAFIGSLVFNQVARILGSLQALLISIVVWLLVILFAYFYLYTEMDFYIVCSVVGIVMGGTQALSRSIYSQLIPSGKESEYFSVYELSEKGTSWLGPFIFAMIYNFTQSYRLAILSLALFFIFGIIALLKFKKKVDCAKKSANN
ncbi:MAG: MFS transporter [Ignavibacteria bacterium]|jgi:UMF1 family MFS transporter|nr:MFS transporter [Ignavibacteria bacterium]